MTTTTANPASEKQAAFIEKLLTDREGFTAEFADRVRAAITSGGLERRKASEIIDWLMAKPRAAKPAAGSAAGGTPIVEVDEGVYVLADGTIVKVQFNKTKTRKYAKRWIEISGTRLVDADESHVHGEWEYEGGLVHQAGLPTTRRMTLDEAKAFILRYGKCVRCGRTLKAAESVEAGIGPVCVTYFGSFS